MNNELERMSKEEPWPRLREYSSICVEGPKGNTTAKGQLVFEPSFEVGTSQTEITSRLQ